MILYYLSGSFKESFQVTNHVDISEGIVRNCLPEVLSKLAIIASIFNIRQPNGFSVEIMIGIYKEKAIVFQDSRFDSEKKHVDIQIIYC